MPLHRIDKILSVSGACSRKDAKALIRRGAVAVNGVIVLADDEKYDPFSAEIFVAGQRLRYRAFHYIMLNKPAGFVSSTEDPREKPVTGLLSESEQKYSLSPAGRLDKDAEGLLLLTNDGDYAHRIISPKHNITKRYYIRYEGELNDGAEAAFAAGITLADGAVCRPAGLERGDCNDATVSLTEGKYHQVKRMIAAAGGHVTYIKRLSIGGLVLDETLKPGEYRELADDEILLPFSTK